MQDAFDANFRGGDGVEDDCAMEGTRDVKIAQLRALDSGGDEDPAGLGGLRYKLQHVRDGGDESVRDVQAAVAGEVCRSHDGIQTRIRAIDNWEWRVAHARAGSLPWTSASMSSQN